MKIGIIGETTAGLSAAAALSLKEFDVTVFSPEEEEREAYLDGILPVFEAGLSQGIRQAVEGGHLSFALRLEKLLDAQIILLGSRLVPDEELETALRFVSEDLLSVVRKAEDDLNVAILTPLPPGSYEFLVKKIDEALSDREDNITVTLSLFPVIADPGRIYAWFRRPSPVMIGTEDKAAAGIIREIARKLGAMKKRILVTTPEKAEAAMMLRDEYALMLRLLANEAGEMDIRPLFRRLTDEMAIPKPGLIPSAEGLLLAASDTGLSLMQDPEKKIEAQNQRIIDRIVERTKEAIEKLELPEDDEPVVLLTGISQYPGSGEMRGAAQIELIRSLAHLPVKLILYLREGNQDLKWRIRDVLENVRFETKLSAAVEEANVVILAGETGKGEHLKRLIREHQEIQVVSPFSQS